MEVAPPCSWNNFKCSHRWLETGSPKYAGVPLRRDLFLLHAMALGSLEEIFWDFSGALLLCCLL